MKSPEAHGGHQNHIKTKKKRGKKSRSEPSKRLILSNQYKKNLAQSSYNLQVYKTLSAQYIMSQTRELYILRIANDPKIPLQFQSFPLASLIRQAACEMHMNDLEIVIWAIYLDRFAWKEFSVVLNLILYITALAVKSYVSSPIHHLNAYLCIKFQQFSLVFNKWLGYSICNLSIPPKELNKKFNYLSSRPSGCSLINYNFILDSILESSPPYQHERNLKQQSELKTFNCNQEHMQAILEDESQEIDEELEESPILARLDSVFAGAIHTTPTSSEKILNPHVEPIQEEEELPQFHGQTSMFSYYLSQI